MSDKHSGPTKPRKNPPTPGKPTKEPAMPVGKTPFIDPGAGKGGNGKGNGKGGGGKPPSSAFVWMQHILQTWGLGDLAHYVKSYLHQGLNWQEIQLNLMDTQEWKQRFAGNEGLRKRGLPELNPAQYLAMEESYHQSAREAGIPAGFIDKHVTDALIGGNVSAHEFDLRVADAAEFVNNTPQVQQAFRQYYGMGKGHAIAAMLDPGRAETVLRQQLTSAEIGGAALENGINVRRGRAVQFAKFGLSLSAARQAYQDISSHMVTDQSIAHRFGTTFGQGQEENAAILGQGAAQRKLQTLYGEEAAQFGGFGGGANTSSNANAGNY